MNRRKFFGRLIGAAVVAKVAPVLADAPAPHTFQCSQLEDPTTWNDPFEPETIAPNSWGNVLYVMTDNWTWQMQSDGSWKNLITHCDG